MPIRKIAQMGEPVLRQHTRVLDPAEIATPAIQTLIDDMIETMHDADGAGIAAPQVYESVRICVMELAGNPRYPNVPALPLTVLVNPVVELLVENPSDPAPEDSVEMFEGCLSVQGVRGRVRRPRRARVRGLGRHGEPIELVLEGPLASVVQHETDHLDGVLFIDRADPRTLTFLREYDRYVPLVERIKDGGAK
jgi:peptide deformylase